MNPWVDGWVAAGALVATSALALSCGPAAPGTLSTFARLLDDPVATDRANQGRAHLVLGDGGKPNVRFVDLENGDQRLAVVSRAPSVLSFRTIVPRGGELRFSLAVRPPRAPVRIALRTAAVAQTLYEETWQRRFGWSDRRVDLSHLQGRSVELRLSVEGAAANVSFANLEIVGEVEAVRRPNVVVYVVDCLRADHVGVYGYERPTTPELDALANDGVVFERAYACAAWTKASTGCLFTSLNPTFHGAQAVGDVMSPEHPTLAQRFRDHGYVTVAWIANPFLYERGFGMTSGFERVVALKKPSRKMSINDFKADAADITRGVVPWLEQNRDRRFFLYLHSIDAHYEYRARPPFDELFVSGHADGPGRSIDLYDNEIAYNDHEIGKLVAALKQLDLYDDTLILVTSDHGEEFGEHGHQRHGKSLHEAVLHIPWVMKVPGGKSGTRVHGLATNLDIAPTLLDYAGIAPPESFTGVSWRTTIDTGESPAPRRLFFEQVEASDVIYAVRQGSVKLISRLRPHPEELLYDIEEDPEERKNLLADGTLPERYRETKDRLSAALGDYMQVGQRGYHVSIHHPDSRSRIVFEAWTDAGVFARVQRFAQELGDELQRSDDGRQVRYEFQAKTRRRHLVMRTEPAGSPIRVRIRANGRDWPSEELGLGENGRVTRMPFEVLADAARVSFDRAAVLVDAPETQAAIWYQLPPVETNTMTLDPELQQRLRALGYLQ